MGSRRKTSIKLNSIDNLQNLMQEVYNDANAQINDAQRAINEMANGSTPEDVQDLTSIAREKGNLLKIKDAAAKIKLELAKLEHEIIKKDTNSDDSGKKGAGVTKDDFKSVRELIKETKQNALEYDVITHQTKAAEDSKITAVEPPDSLHIDGE
jgi:ribosomal protein L35